jgi:hypothetical protein
MKEKLLEGNIESSPIPEIERKHLSIYRLCMNVYA